MNRLLELGATIFTKILWKLLNEVFPTNLVSNSKEIIWEIDISKKGVNVKYEKNELLLNNKQIISLINDDKLSKEFSDLRQKIIKTSGDLDKTAYKIKSKGNQHALEVNEGSTLQGSMKFKEKITYDEIYKRVFLRGETIPIEKVSFDTMNPEMKSEIDSFKQKLSELSSLSLKANNSPNIINCNAFFESASSKNKYYKFSVGLSLYDYTEGSTSFKNHFDEDSLINLMLTIPLNVKENEEVKLNYSLSEQGSKDTNALLDYNTLQRLLAHEHLKLTIRELETNILLFSGILPKMDKDVGSIKKELEHEANTLKIIQKAEKTFGVKFQVPRELEKGDQETLNILDMLFNENTKVGKSKGVISMTFKPNGLEVLGWVEGDLTLTQEYKTQLFGTEINSITRIISFYNIREVGQSFNNRRRLSDGSLEIKFHQFKNRRVEERFMFSQ